MPDYHGTFRAGELVQVVDPVRLTDFRDTWRHHHQVNAEQMPFASRVARVAEVAYYHGGDPLYSLEGVPGMWHECCLVEPGRDTAQPAADVFWLREETRDGKTLVVVQDLSGVVRHAHESSIWNGDLSRVSAVLRARSAEGFASRYEFA